MQKFYIEPNRKRYKQATQKKELQKDKQRCIVFLQAKRYRFVKHLSWEDVLFLPWSLSVLSSHGTWNLPVWLDWPGPEDPRETLVSIFPVVGSEPLPIPGFFCGGCESKLRALCLHSKFFTY